MSAIALPPCLFEKGVTVCSVDVNVGSGVVSGFLRTLGFVLTLLDTVEFVNEAGLDGVSNIPNGSSFEFLF